MKSTSSTAKQFAASWQKAMSEKFSAPDAKQLPPSGPRKTYSVITGKK